MKFYDFTHQKVKARRELETAAEENFPSLLNYSLTVIRAIERSEIDNINLNY